MGCYYNPGLKGFQEAINSPIYVDKSMLIQQTNACLNTQQKFMCISRPRRFGKSMAANLLAAYYGLGCDAAPLFAPLQIASVPSWRTHLNQYHVLKINMQEFLSATGSVEEMLDMLKRYVTFDLLETYEQAIRFRDEKNFFQMLKDVYVATGKPFVILIDEWDCLFREYAQDTQAQKKYLDFLRAWLKDQEYVALAYMTGILPIKKYGTHSALNMFTEYSMTDPGNLAPYFGFTEQEVRALCDEYRMSFEEAKAWYDGYHLLTRSRDGDTYYSMYNPKSMVEAMMRHNYGTYWNRTETYEALKVYIQMDMDGLKDAVVQMLAGSSVEINIGTFANDMTTFATKDDVLTLLVHLGYLTYDSQQCRVAIPNKEVAQEYVNAISTMSWGEVMRSVTASKQLLQALWDMDADAVARGVDRVHDEIAILQYNDENSLSCTIHLAFYAAREYYTMIRELPTGKGFADICLIPRPLHADKPAVVIELKKDKDAQGAIAQIKQKQYGRALEAYRGNLLLVGINYDKNKKHTCVIEKVAR